MQEIAGDITGLQVDQAEVAADAVVGVDDQIIAFQIGQRRFEDPLPAAHPVMGSWAENFIVADDGQLFLGKPETVIQVAGGHGQPDRHLQSGLQLRDPVHRQIAWRQQVEQAFRPAALVTNHKDPPLFVQPVLQTLDQEGQAAVMFGMVRP